MSKKTQTILIIFLLLPILLFSQERPGQFKGTVTDSTTGEALTGANIMIKGTSIGTPTNIDGKFSIPKIQPGNYILRISYIGYNAKEVDVKLLSGKTLELNIKLSGVSLKGDEVVVTSQAVGQNEAINQQIASIPIKNIVSATKIKELPDENAAAALARLPGISVQRKSGEAEQIRIRGVDQNTFYVNGMRMEGSNLAAISSNMMGGLEVQKSFTPDMDADVTGGAVSVKMNEARSGFRGDVWGRTGYNDLTKSFQIHNLSVLLSNRFFNDKLGVLLSLTYDKRDRGSERFSGSYQTIGSAQSADIVKTTQISSMSLTYSQNIRDRYGATLYMDYKLGEGKLYYQGFLAYMDWTDKSFVNGYNPYSHATLTYSGTIAPGERLTFLNGIGGEHPLFGGKLDWLFSLSKSDDRNPQTLGTSAAFPAGIGNISSIDSTSSWEDIFEISHHDITLTPLESSSVSETHTTTTEKTFKMDFSVPFSLSNSLNGSLKFGTKLRRVSSEHIGWGASQGYYQGYLDGSAIALERVPDIPWVRTSDKNYLGYGSLVPTDSRQDYNIFDNYIYFKPDFDLLKKLVDGTKETFYANRLNQLDNYWGDEDLYAGYAMATFNIGTLIDFTPGVRYEYNKNTKTAVKFIQNRSGGPLNSQGQYSEVTASSSNEHWFPMAQLRVIATDFLDFRFAYSKTLSRPPNTFLSPKFMQSKEGNRTLGNMDLQPQKNYNFDFYASLYSNHVGLFTIGLFYKEIEDQVMDYSFQILHPEDLGLSESFKNSVIRQPINNKWPGYVKGLEFDWQTHFWYLPGFLDGFLLSVNFTIMDSETKYPFFSYEKIWVGPPTYYDAIGIDSSRTSKLSGQPDYIGNLTLGYEKGGFSGRISMYYQGPTLTEIPNRLNKALDISQADLYRFDVQLSQKLFVEGLIFYLNLNNITSYPDRQYLTYSPESLARQENYGWSGDIGVRYKF